jgi:hypothetical protein
MKKESESQSQKTGWSMYMSENHQSGILIFTAKLTVSRLASIYQMTRPFT